MSRSEDPLRIFGVAPRVRDAAKSWEAVHATIGLAEAHGFDGVLLFEGNDVFVDPWVTAQILLERTSRLCPLVALNPVYMHPFTTARKIASLSNRYRRPVHLNLITGTAMSDLEAMNDDLTHRDRYERLAEYTDVVFSLLCATPRATEGYFYRTVDLRLKEPIDASLLPTCFVAGQSDAAIRLARDLGATSMQMLPPTLTEGLNRARAVNLGIVTRPTREQAWSAARRKFPDDVSGAALQELSMANTESHWKRKMFAIAESDAAPGYWMGPFRNGWADSPFFVGEHDCVARLVTDCQRRGVDTLILDLAPDDEEFQNLAMALASARA